MTEAEKIAARMRVFSALGLDPITGMCPTTVFPTLRNVQARNDAAAGEILDEHELEICSQHEIAPSTFLAAKGSTKPVGSRDDIADGAMVEATRESLAKFCAGVGGPRNRNHLFMAQAAISRMLKRS